MYTVLIVEDEILVSVGLKNMVRWSDLNMVIVGEARNGQQGLEMYREKKPDLILTDIKMPVMDGIELIRQIRKEDTKTKIVVLTGYEDFELVRQSFMLGISDYILKLKMLPEEIEEVVRKVSDELSGDSASEAQQESDREEQLDEARVLCRDIILQGINDRENGEISRLIGVLGVETADLTVGVMECFPLRKDVPVGYQEEKVEQIILNLIRNILSEYCKGDILPQKDGKYLLLLNLNELKKQGIPPADMFQRIKTSVQTYVNVLAAFGISSCADCCQDLHRLYGEADSALEQACFFGESLVFFEDADLQESFEAILTEFENKIEAWTFLGDDYCWKIRKEIAFLKKMRRPRGAEIREILIRWIHQISLDRGILKEEMLKTTLKSVEKIRSMVSLPDMLKAFEECVLILDESMKKSGTVKREVEETIAYIQDNYRDAELSVAKAALAVDLNKDYLSNLFKKEMGISFSDYVNIQRIKKARELLTNTHLKTYEIAYEVGFQDVGYFSRVFKKIVGIRPGEYKKGGFSHVETLGGGPL